MKNIKNIFKSSLLAILFLSIANLSVATDNPNIEVSTLPDKPNIRVETWHMKGDTFLAGGYLISRHENILKLWDPYSKKFLNEFDCECWIKHVEFSVDGRYMVTGCGPVKVWDVRSGENVWRIDSEKVCQFKISPHCKFIVTKKSTDKISLWNIQDENFIYSIDCVRSIDCVSFSPCENFMAYQAVTKISHEVLTEVYGNVVKVLNLKEMVDTQRFDCEYYVDEVLFSVDGKFIFARQGQSVCVIELSCEQMYKLNCEADIHCNLALSTSGFYLATRSYSAVSLWNFSSKACVCNIRNIWKLPNDIIFLTNGLIAICYDFTVELWSFEPNFIYKFSLDSKINSLFIGKDGQIMVSLCDGKVKVFTDLSTQKTLQESKDRILALAQALHPRCGASSLANILTQNDLPLIYNMIEDRAGLTPWKNVFGR